MQLPNVLLYQKRAEDLLEDRGSVKGKERAAEAAGDDSTVSAAQMSWTANADNHKMPPIYPVLTDFGISFFSPECNGCPVPDNQEDYIGDI